MEDYKKIIDFEKLSEIVLISNTPSFLYQSFVKNQSIIDLYDSYLEKDLRNWFYEEFSKERNLKNSVILYSLIVTLSLYNTPESDEFFVTIKDLKDLKWLKELYDIYSNKIVFDTFEKSTKISYAEIDTSCINENETINFSLS